MLLSYVSCACYRRFSIFYINIDLNEGIFNFKIQFSQRYSIIIFISDKLKRKLVVATKTTKDTHVRNLLSILMFKACVYKYLNSLMVPINSLKCQIPNSKVSLQSERFDTYHKFPMLLKILSFVFEILRAFESGVALNVRSNF